MPILSLFPSSGTASLEQQIAAVVASMETHTSNTTVHITADERSAWNAKASGTHTHGMADVTGLVTALAGKAASDHSHDGRYYTETEMNDKLAKKSDTDHVHKQADVTGLVTALADKAPLSHTHDDRYYTEDEIDAKLVVKHLVGTTENPTDLTTITETGTYYISGPITETNTEVAEAIGPEHLPLYVYTETTHDELTDTTTTDTTQIVFGMLDSGIFYRTLPNATEWSVNRLSLSGHSHTISDIPTLSTQLNLKANLSVLNAHTGNNTIHLTGDDRTKLSGMCNVTTGSFVGASSAELTFDFEPSLVIAVVSVPAGDGPPYAQGTIKIVTASRYYSISQSSQSLAANITITSGTYLSGNTATFQSLQTNVEYTYIAFGS